MDVEKNINPEQFSDVKRQNWDAEEIAEESTNKSSDEIVREMTRGGETDGEADDRDPAGGVETANTPHGREETKK